MNDMEIAGEITKTALEHRGSVFQSDSSATHEEMTKGLATNTAAFLEIIYNKIHELWNTEHEEAAR